MPNLPSTQRPTPDEIPSLQLHEGYGTLVTTMALAEKWQWGLSLLGYLETLCKNMLFGNVSL